MKAANDNSPRLSTAFLLMAQYNGAAIIPVESVCRDYFSHLDPGKFIRKVGAGEIAIPMVRMEASQKSAKGVHLQDLADYLDSRRAAALRECRGLAS
ncbi:pyocin activator PrtN family protein [Bradyrhizobium ottawaense]|uniref:pyocin activator PrtN family protein n=1 Tax=Bradyrhizobium ottawaense TaxID=931866 RepID=UPI0030F3E549